MTKQQRPGAICRWGAVLAAVRRDALRVLLPDAGIGYRNSDQMDWSKHRPRETNAQTDRSTP